MDNTYLNIKDKAMYLHSRRMHSIGEMRKKLQRSFEDKTQVIEKVLSELIEKKILDDQYFANAFARELVEYRGASIGKVRRKLVERMISKDIIQATLLSIAPEKVQGNLIDHFEKTMQSLRFKNLELYDLRQKVMQRLSAKGFFYDEIKTLCDERLPI